MPTVSIGLPVYNGERYLQAALDSLRAQTYTDFEVVVADNASTDATAAIVQAAAAEDPRIRYVRNATNIGALPNFNRVFHLATGRYFKWHAYDDLLAPTALAQYVAALEADPDAVLAYGQSVLIDEHGHAMPYDDALQGFRTPDGGWVPADRRLERDLGADVVHRYTETMRSNSIDAATYGLFRRATLEQTSLHVYHGSDNLLVAEVALRGRFAYIPAPLFYFRIHPGCTRYLDREAWSQRERGEATQEPPFALVRTFWNYHRAVVRADLTLAQRLGALRANVGYAVRPHVLRNLFLPGPANYFGLKRWPWQATATS